MSDHSEAYVAFDTSKLRNAVAIADAGRAGEIRFLGEIENTAEVAGQRGPHMTEVGGNLELGNLLPARPAPGQVRRDHDRTEVMPLPAERVHLLDHPFERGFAIEQGNNDDRRPEERLPIERPEDGVRVAHPALVNRPVHVARPIGTLPSA